MLPPGDRRCYPKWIAAQHRFSPDSVGKKRIPGEIQEWITLQGGNPDGLTFDTNSGRKTLGKWLAELQIQYSWSFEIMGDLWVTWKKHYQHNLISEPLFNRRTQSKNADECCRALRAFTRRLLGYGKPCEDPKLEFRDELIVMQLRALGQGDQVNQLLDKHFA